MLNLSLPNFLELVDGYTKQMNKEDLALFIHNLARKSSANKRNDFINELKSYCITKKFFSEIDKQKLEQEKNDVIEYINIIIHKLQKISNKEVRLQCDLNEEYDDWYNNNDEEYIFTDPHKLLEDIEVAFSLVNTCITFDLIEEGYKLSELLNSLIVYTEGEYYGDDLDICTLTFYHLLKTDDSYFYKRYLYLVYRKHNNIDRPEKIFNIFDSYRGFEITLEDVIQIGNQDLPNFKEFLPLWIEYLAKQTRAKASTLLKEAQTFVTDDMALANARKFTDTSPELYLEILNKQNKLSNYKNALSIGLEAIDSVKNNPKIKAKIALCTSVFAFKLEKNDIREKCWIEAFNSNQSILNYLRIKFSIQNPEQYNELISSKIKKMANSKLDSDAIKDFCTILFFEKKFSEMESIGNLTTHCIEAFFHNTQILCLNLMMLLLFHEENFPKGLSKIANSVVKEIKFNTDLFYLKEIDDSLLDTSQYQFILCNSNDSINFSTLLSSWKKTFSLSNHENAYWLTKIKTWIQKTVSSVMTDNRRKQYYECAMYIAAFGEILESQGIVNGKNIFMQEYKTKYSRRVAFHSSLYSFGLQ